MIYINILYIAIIISLVWNVLHFPEELSDMISRKRGKTFNFSKPFSCSTCMTWWLSFFYLLITWKITLFNIVICLLLACSTSLISTTFYLVRDLITNILSWIGERIDRINKR